jgi:competence protein ComEA
MWTSLSSTRLCPGWSAFATIALIGLALPAAAAAQLPAGPGQAETIKLCGTCHPPERGASVRLTREGWEDVITKMVGLGAKGTDAELDAVLDYLATHFKGEAAVPLNLNRATSVELESIAGFLRRESAAWMAHRAKRPCTTLDDLRAVPGVDFKKIEKRRERLVCF